MARTRLIAVNGNAGAFVPISATQVTRYVEIIEDGSANGGTGEGFQYQFADGQTPQFTTVYTIEPVSEPIKLGTPVAFGAGHGLVIGTPVDSSGGFTLPATLLINLRSASATATIARVTEFD